MAARAVVSIGAPHSRMVPIVVAPIGAVVAVDNRGKEGGADRLPPDYRGEESAGWDYVEVVGSFFGLMVGKRRKGQDGLPDSPGIACKEHVAQG